MFCGKDARRLICVLSVCTLLRPPPLKAGNLLGVHSAYEEHLGSGGQIIRDEWYAVKSKGFEIPCEVADPGLSW